MADDAARSASGNSCLGPESEDREDRSRSHFPDEFLELTPSPDEKPHRPGATSRRGSRKRPVAWGGTGRASSSPGQLRGMVRPPNLDPQGGALLEEHVQFGPAGDTAEARLLNLERQSNYDHKFFTEVQKSVNKLYDIMKNQDVQHKESCQLGLQPRRELFAVRDGVPDVVKHEVKTATDALPGHLQDLANKMIAPIIEQTIDQISQTITELQVKMGQLTDRSGALETYIEALHGERPREGQRVIHTFQQMDQEISTVKEMVKRFEVNSDLSRAKSSFQGNGMMTKEMLDQLHVIHGKMSSLDQLHAGYENMFGRVNFAYDLAEKLNVNHSNLIARLDTMDVTLMTMAGDGQFQGMTAEMCGGTAAAQWTSGPFRPAECAGGCHGPSQPPAPGPPGSSNDGDGDKTQQILQAVTGGNGVCHCIQVNELVNKVAVLEAQARALQDPWWSGAQRSTADQPSAAMAGPQSGRPAKLAKKSLPLELPGPLGGILRADRPLFDDKLMTHDEYRFNGTKGGVQWKSKLERYFIAKAPILKEIFEWAEEEDMEVITVERFKQAAGHRLNDEQIATVNAAIRGFLSGVLSGLAETLFKRAEMLNGLDAWRRMVRHIDHGRPIQLESLRREVKTLHLKPIKDLEHIEEGIAEFENTILKYTQAGGTPFQDQELKSDLLAILPAKIRENLLWQSQDEGDFEKIRDIVLTQTQKILQNQHPRSLNNIDEHEAVDDEGNIDFEKINGMEDLVAFVKKFGNKMKFNKVPGADRGGGDRRDQTVRPERRPRECPNCGKEHAALKCPEGGRSSLLFLQ